MQIGKDIGFFASALNSIIMRYPFFIEGKDKKVEPYLRQILSFVPAYREVIVAGNIPKWVRYLPIRPKELPAEDERELVETVTSLFEEEGLGRPPLQFIYFGATIATYNGVLKKIPKGWIATVESVTPIIKELGNNSYYVEELGEAALIHLEDKPKNIEFETKLLQRVKDLPGAVVSFVVQKKLNEMHLAGQAIMREVEEGSAFSQAEVEELFELDEITLQKLIELLKQEYSVDLRSYIGTAPAEVKSMIDVLTNIEHLIAIAAVSKRQVVALKRLRDFEVSMSQLARLLIWLHGRASEIAQIGKKHHILLVSENGFKAVAMVKDKIGYVLLFGKEARSALCVAAVKDKLNL